MLVLSKIDIVREKIRAWQQGNELIGLVPTMGALHKGHESLITKAKDECDKVVVSIFVNPAQFGPNEDYAKYPRQFEEDRKTCLHNKVDMIFAPDASEMYNGAFNTMVVAPDVYKDKLCGLSRKNHFNGVTTIVAKLFNIVTPDIAYFGLKDAQQVIIINKMVSDLNIPVKIKECPIIRDIDGLACSSRNAYLSREDREKALCLYRILTKVQSAYSNGIENVKDNFNLALKALNDGVELEYLEAYNFNTFEQAEYLYDRVLVAIAAKVGNVRLIDNIVIGCN